MLNDIGEIIVGRISNLPFIDKYAGVVRVISRDDVDSNQKPVKKIFPASCKNPIPEECDFSRYFDLCPDSSKKSVLYLEDNGVRFKSIDGNKVYFIAQFDLVCWLNLPLLGKEECNYSAKIILAIINKLIGKGVPFQSGIYQRIFIKPIGEKSKSQNPFSKYTYDLEKNQYLVYPFDWFVLLLEVEFMIDSRCADEIILNEPLECLKQ